MKPSSDDFCKDYARRLQCAFHDGPWGAVGDLAATLLLAMQQRASVFLAGNGGSAANAMHLANDFLYGMGREIDLGLRVEALPSNPSVITCLANDLSYEQIFAKQVRVKGAAGDILIVLSGSGNSPNVVRALEAANQIGMKTFAILGYSGGRCRDVARVPIHFAVDDMQIAEDLQLVVGHICMQWVREQVKQGVL